MSSEIPLQVTIDVNGDYLLISNLVQLRPQTKPSTGLGLKNIVKRYQLLTDQPVCIENEANDFVVKIPLLPA
jgi:two-component system, LytTR family, sensor kinase